jgi:ribosome biogenesis ATPase
VPAGVLLFGPPGCGKTLLAKAIASESNANFISVKGPELLDKYVGESERAVRQVFQRARSSAPCVIFFDELDALAPRRGGPGSGGGGNVSERVVNQLLTEMDGLDVRRDVFVVAATNRPDIIDPAMLRPGRLDKLLYVPLPTADEREAILRTQMRRTPLGPEVDVRAIATDARCTRFSGADLAGLVREASVAALKEHLAGVPSSAPVQVLVQHRHFMLALDKAMPSVSAADERAYNTMKTKLRNSRSHVGTESASAGSTGAARVE